MYTQSAAGRRFNVSTLPRPSGAYSPRNTFLNTAGLVSTEEHYARDEELYGEGEPAEFVHEVASGALRSYKLLSDGRRQIAGFHLPGDLVGIESGSTYQLTGEAMVDTVTRLFRRRSLEACAEQDGALAYRLWSATALGLRQAKDHMLLLGRKTAMERVASFLLEMAHRLNANPSMELPMSRQDIADYLGLTLETVSRIFSQLQKEGLLVLSDARRVSLMDTDRLKNMVA